MAIKGDAPCISITSSTQSLAELLASHGCEVLLQGGRAQPQWVSGSLYSDRWAAPGREARLLIASPSLPCKR